MRRLLRFPIDIARKAYGLARFFASTANRASFCLLPWVGLYVDDDGRVYPCCHFAKNAPAGLLFEDAPGDIVDSRTLRRVRRDMLAGREVPECANCRRAERAGLRRTRAWAMAAFSHHLYRTRDTTPDGALEGFQPPYLDLFLSNRCNFRCRMCGPRNSSAWADEALKLPGAPVRPQTPPRPLDLIARIEPLLENVEAIHFCGGEPLLADEHDRLLRIMIARRMFHVRLKYSTNFSVTTSGGQDVFELWDRFESVEVAASLDAAGARGEYLRKGMDWERTLANRRRMLAAAPRAVFKVAATLTAMNAHHLPDLHREWVENGLLALRGLKISPVLEHAEYGVPILTDRLRRQAERRILDHITRFIRPRDPLDRFHPLSIEKSFRSVIAQLERQHDPEGLRKFRARTRLLDELRGESFSMTFPELSELMAS